MFKLNSEAVVTAFNYNYFYYKVIFNRYYKNSISIVCKYKYFQIVIIIMRETVHNMIAQFNCFVL